MNNDDRESTFADFRMVYQALLDNLENTKRRQWSLLYYLLLLFAAIVGFSKTIGLDKIGYFCWEKWALLGIAIAIAGFGTRYLCYLTGKMIRYRERLEDARSHLSPDFKKFEDDWLNVRCAHKKWCDLVGIRHIRKTWCNFWKKREKCYSWWKAFWELSLYLTIMLWIGFVFVLYYLLRDC